MKITKGILAAAAMAATVIAGSGTAQASSCTVNIYRVNSTPAGVWTLDGVFLKDKAAGNTVTGPNSNVMNINTSNGWRKIYLGGGQLAMMYPGYLDYTGCQ
ncbi:hypothetical protein [Streptosporangium sp. NPDC023615]|uniref:hypothetical protein n=1 Tax=Streptosporangium sp. NPDC023615 TaxID=3154794 RepID=UPI003440E2BB